MNESIATHRKRLPMMQKRIYSAFRDAAKARMKAEFLERQAERYQQLIIAAEEEGLREFDIRKYKGESSD